MSDNECEDQEEDYFYSKNYEEALIYAYENSDIKKINQILDKIKEEKYTIDFNLLEEYEIEVIVLSGFNIVGNNFKTGNKNYIFIDRLCDYMLPKY